ncbi:MAG: CRTAC1 family protein [Chloroherpetonaceae bacterium]|nr:CRTAC1 family protein [Chthonomonadaceae bacterium]MDW8206275.1 CRTAC1 family protein [Chloroherpetonaceae bacterium]
MRSLPNGRMTLLLLGIWGVALCGCRSGGKASGSEGQAPASASSASVSTEHAATARKPEGLAALPDRVRFTDITQQAGINFTHFSGARGRKYMPEIETPGCAFFDYDNDGRPDILLLNGADWRNVKTGRRRTRTALYHNEGNGRFRDVSAGSGLDIEMHTMGVTVGDYDNDGYDDLYITCIMGPSRLFRNLNGTGKFQDVTLQAGVHNESKWGSGCAFFDYDRDGRLDLVVGNYCKWTPETDVFCSVYKGTKSYCTPNVYDGESVRLYHNEGSGRFRDVSREAGVINEPGKTWGVVILDYDGDGWPDIALANDMEPNCLFRNRGDGTFEEVALVAGIALGENGTAKAGMGIDAADIDRSGRPSLIITNFAMEGVSLFLNQGGGMFTDASHATGVHNPSLLLMGWGVFFFDYDLDGWQDALVCNGHLYDNVHKFQPDMTFAEPPLLFRNQGGKFVEVSRERGRDLVRPMVTRGSAYADIDGDGDLDVLLMENDGRARLLRNDGGNANRCLRVRTEGVRSNRNGIGAKVEVEAGGVRQTQWVKSSAGFLSCSERTLTFGLGQLEKVERVRITWPSGQVDTYTDVRTGQTLLCREGASGAEISRR